MEKDIFYAIANIIDNDFAGSFETFTCERRIGYHLLSTNRCDEASMIRIYNDFNTVFKIERSGPDTDGYEDIQSFTKQKISLFLYQKDISEDLITLPR